MIPHFGDPAPTVALVDLLRAQDGVDIAQIVVSDDCSPVPFPDVDGVTVVRRTTNGGFGANVNSGLAEVRSPYALVLNSDLEISPTFVRDIVEAAGPWQPAVVGPALIDAGGVSAYSGRHFPTMCQQVVEWLTPLVRLRGTRLLHEAVGHDTRAVPGATVLVDWVVGAAMLLPMDEVRDVGGFDERFFMNAEEVDLQRRLRERGVPSVYVGSVVVTHEGGGSSDPERRLEWLLEGRRIYAAKWGGLRRLQGGLTAASVVNLVWAAARRLAGRPTEPMRRFRQDLDLIWGARR